MLKENKGTTMGLENVPADNANGSRFKELQNRVGQFGENVAGYISTHRVQIAKGVLLGVAGGMAVAFPTEAATISKNISNTIQEVATNNSIAVRAGLSVAAAAVGGTLQVFDSEPSDSRVQMLKDSAKGAFWAAVFANFGYDLLSTGLPSEIIKLKEIDKVRQVLDSLPEQYKDPTFLTRVAFDAGLSIHSLTELAKITNLKMLGSRISGFLVAGTKKTIKKEVDNVKKKKQEEKIQTLQTYLREIMTEIKNDDIPEARELADKYNSDYAPPSGPHIVLLRASRLGIKGKDVLPYIPVLDAPNLKEEKYVQNYKEREAKRKAEEEAKKRVQHQSRSQVDEDLE